MHVNWKLSNELHNTEFEILYYRYSEIGSNRTFRTLSDRALFSNNARLQARSFSQHSRQSVRADENRTELFSLLETPSKGSSIEPSEDRWAPEMSRVQICAQIRYCDEYVPNIPSHLGWAYVIGPCIQHQISSATLLYQSTSIDGWSPLLSEG